MQWEATEAIGQGWTAVKSQAGPLIGALVVYLIIVIVLDSLLSSVLGIASVRNFDFQNLQRLQEQLERMQQQPLAMTTVKAALMGVVQTFFAAGFIKQSLAAARGEQVSFGDLFSGGASFLPLLLLGALAWVAKLLGPMGMIGPHIFGGGLTFVLVQLMLIPPAIYISLALSQASYFVVDQKMNPIDAIKASFSATKGQKVQIFLFWVLAFLLIIAGFIACCVGLLVAIPIMEVGAALIYVRLTGTPGNGNQFAGYGGPPGMGGGWGPPPGGGYGGPPPGGGYGGPPPGGGYGGPPPGGGYGGPPPGGGYGGPPPGGGYGGPPPAGGYGPPPGGYGGPPPGGGYGPPGGQGPY